MPHRKKNVDYPVLLRDAVAQTIARIDGRRQTLRIAHTAERWRAPAAASLHAFPEIFMQIHGATDFTLPGQTMRLQPGQGLIVPAGVAHAELCRPDRRDFRNLVVMLYGGMTQIHLAGGAEGEKPHIEYREEYLHARPPLLYTLTAACCAQEDAQAALRRALHLALCESIASLLAAGSAAPAEHPRVAQIKLIIRQQAHRPALSVKDIARQLRCNADYISHLFRTQTGHTLSSWLCRQRLESAERYLRDSPLNIAEIARNCGFTDASYFTLIFRRHFDMSPRAFRRKIQTREPEHG